MPFGYAAAAGGSILSGIMGSQSAKKAADAQVEAAKIASDTELQMFDKTQKNLQPWMAGGENALNQLQKLLGIGADGAGAGSPVLAALGIGPGGQPGTATSPFQQSPGYNFAKQQGMDAIINGASRGGGMGGNTLKALTTFGTGVANQDYYNYLSALNSGWQGLTGNLFGISGQGAGAATNLGSFGTQVAGQVAGNQIGAGNAQAAGIMGSTNAITGAINTGLKNIMSLYQNNQNSSVMDSGGWTV